MSTGPLPPFIDSAHAAEILHITPESVLDLIAAGRLAPFAGPPTKPFLRSADVVALAAEMGAGEEPEPPRRVKSGFARVQTRITADARWGDVSEQDLEEFARRADPAKRVAAAATAAEAMVKLEALIELLDGQE
ncbi:MAG TPA: hypothetical protein VFA78_07335 [Chloroflexota bacterium]|nr:hypothetical protein [Chloroflexota bacterium]